MRGDDEQSGHLFSYLSPEQRVPADHPLRPIRQMTDAAQPHHVVGDEQLVIAVEDDDVLGHEISNARGNHDSLPATRLSVRGATTVPAALRAQTKCQSNTAALPTANSAMNAEPS